MIDEPRGDCFVVAGGRPLGGTLVPAGNKNEALPVLAAALLAPGEHHIANLPRIRDVGTLLEILAGLGVRAALPVGGSQVRLETSDLNGRTPSADLGGTIRGSFLLAPGLLHRTGRAVLPRPGGDRIGRRRVDTHLHALRMLGAEIEPRERQYHLRLDGRFRGTDIFFDEASVMATENAVMAAAVADGPTRIANAASEPHVQGLCRLPERDGRADPRRRHERARDRRRAGALARRAPRRPRPHRDRLLRRDRGDDGRRAARRRAYAATTSA